jgi:hypothetical protein
MLQVKPGEVGRRAADGVLQITRRWSEGDPPPHVTTCDVRRVKPIMVRCRAAWDDRAHVLQSLRQCATRRATWYRPCHSAARILNPRIIPAKNRLRKSKPRDANRPCPRRYDLRGVLKTVATRGGNADNAYMQSITASQTRAGRSTG